MANNDWWSRKLTGQPAPQQASSTPPTSMPGQVPYVAQPGQPNTQVTYNPKADQVERKNSANRCPECNSGNYAKVGIQSTQNGSFDVMRCYDCGYPKMQTGSGITSSSSGGAATPAKQPAKGNGFNPSVIVDRIG